MYSVLLPNMNIYTENRYLLMSLEKSRPEEWIFLSQNEKSLC